MDTIWEELLENLAMVALLLSAWAHFHPQVEARIKISRTALFGIWMGAAAIVSMSMAVEFERGIYGDFRTAIISMSGLFGGPVAAALTCIITLAYRLSMGGAGALYGVVLICVVGAMSCVAHLALNRRALAFSDIVVYAAVLSGVSYLLSISPISPVQAGQANDAYIPLRVMGFLSTVIAGLSIIKIRGATVERDLLRAALRQSPDFYYVKDRQSRFRTVNNQVARHNGFENPRDMIGLSDADIASPERAKQLFEDEQELISSGRPILNREERLDNEGVERWFSTSKVPLYDESGHPIGLAGVTHDITERKRLEAELIASRNLLAHAMKEMSDGLAMLDKDGRLVFSNDRYREYFPGTADLQVPGVHITELLKAAIQNKEAVSVLTAERLEQIRVRGASFRTDSDFEVQTESGRWLSIRTRVAEDGTSLVVASDITQLKANEIALMKQADHLKILADTDGLTGLANRRAFDKALQHSVAKSLQSGNPVSLILLDVDRFKAFNDYYGHSAGDDCLRVLATCLAETKVRVNDTVARYGGEEFAILLPDTDRAGAVAIASRFQAVLKLKAVPHLASEKGIVTSSIGIVTAEPGGTTISASIIINRADEALYHAKAAGRDCIRVWEPNDAPHPVSESRKSDARRD
ncbi:diguanylate cyclase [Pararhizobium gei]|uniref:diguanylate cyclase n=1 Tax=Pararhizobium gei TaxID=1395951 RepID=UPI0023DA93C6|nr:diguanylate cyclase [Rhizobium gei]